jgi:hypothetical protein
MTFDHRERERLSEGGREKNIKQRERKEKLGSERAVSEREREREWR